MRTRVKRWAAAAAVGLSLWSVAQAAAEVGQAAPVVAQCPPQAPRLTRELLAQAREQVAERGFLWRISRDGRDSYLYGTLHAGRAQWLWPGPRLESALHHTGVLALELDPMDSDVRSQLRAVSQRAAWPLSVVSQQALLQAWRAECLDEAELERGPLEWHVLRLSVARAQRLGLYAEFGAEAVLMMRNARTERPVRGLEEVSAQLQVLLAQTPQQAQDLVDEALREYQRPDWAAQITALTEVWAQSDWERMQRYEHWCECLNSEADRATFERLVTRRNAPMAVAIERLHAQQSVLAAVGTLHLVGEQGLPALLKARGFGVTRVF